MLTLEEIFPPFALRIVSGPVVLSVLRDDDLPELVELVRGGIQDPDLPMPFLRDWHEEPFAPPATSTTAATGSCSTLGEARSGWMSSASSSRPLPSFAQAARSQSMAPTACVTSWGSTACGATRGGHGS